MRSSTVLLTETTEQKAYLVGQKVPGAGYFGGTDGLHTVQIIVSGLVGRVFIQASLANNPQDHDWFPVLLDGQPYIEFPMESSSRSFGYSFVGNYTWIRGLLDRRYRLPDGTADDDPVYGMGTLDRLLLML